MLEKIPGFSGSDDKEHAEPDDLPEDLSVADIREDEDLSPQDLPREVKIRLLFSEAPTTLRQLRYKWNNERIELYFLLLSIVAASGMLILMLYDRTPYVIGLFAVYTAVMIPLLYIHEEERYFKDESEISK